MVGGFNKKTSRSQRRRKKGQSKISKRQTSGNGKNLDKERKWPYFLIIFLIVALGVLQIYFSNKLATLGKKLSLYENEINLIEEGNERLKNETASFGGLNQLTLIASDKGFVKNPPIVNLSSKVPVALKSR